MTRRGSLELSRSEILGYRRRVGVLDRRAPSGAVSIRLAALAGLQDSMPRAAVLSSHARVEATGPDGWADPALVQVWGPRFSVFAVAADDVAAFTLGRLPAEGAARRRAEQTADRLDCYLAGRTMTYRAAAEGLGVHPNSLRYAAVTGRVLVRWEGHGQPVVWMVDPPDVTEQHARMALARRYLRVFGPGTTSGFSQWAGVPARTAKATFATLGDELVPVVTPIGPGRMLIDDATAARQAGASEPAPARLLSSGDAYYLYWGTDRELLVPEARRRAELWTSRVWPGAILVDGEIVGTWRRADTDLTLTAWDRLSARQRNAVETEAAALPIPSTGESIRVRWSQP